MRSVLTATGPVPVEVTWLRYVEPARWPGWSPQMRRVDCSDPVIRAGSTGRVHTIVGLALDFTVLSVDPVRRRWSWRVQAPLGIEMTLDHLVVAAPVDEFPDGGSCTALRVTGPAPLVLGYGPIAKSALRKLVDA
ncbi:SRPBCC family protein [Nakamurella leprariae]|uniref:SRPBCC family protein n=1 Tax=Nakamurella leprariae TaxID=2803911 RepID=A0A939BXJ9_9ACTN|nr:SRPBCC family protein [Nakamurella leprariae]MBM9466060.1 SRPBCC family protein [Nakamurella leprariae]